MKRFFVINKIEINEKDKRILITLENVKRYKCYYS